MNTRRLRSRGFSLIEMMVSLGLLSLLVLVLFSLFNQTTKAMRANSNQIDVMEGARSGLEILNRELENMVPSGVVGAPNFVTYPSDSARELFGQSVQQLGVSLVPVHQDLFFLQRTDAKRVKVVGFVVRDEDQSGFRTLFPVGTLYRYEDPDPRFNNERLSPIVAGNTDYLPMIVTAPNARDIISYRLLDRTKSGLNDQNGPDGGGYRSGTLTNLARVVDGVVSFRVTAYDQLNRPLDATIWNYPDYNAAPPFPAGRQPRPPTLPIFDSVNLFKSYDLTGSSVFIQSSRLATDSSTDFSSTLVGSLFVGDGLPTTVEIELAVLEPRALDQYRALPAAATGGGAREKYIKSNLGRIQIFRQRVPIRTAQR